jgi:hypothetical protein
MKVRVADVYRSGLNWEFNPAETEELTGDSSQQITFPPATDLFSSAIKGDQSLKNTKPGAIKFTTYPIFMFDTIE